MNYIKVLTLSLVACFLLSPSRVSAQVCMDTLRIDHFRCVSRGAAPYAYCVTEFDRRSDESCDTDPSVCSTNAPVPHSNKLSTCRNIGTGSAPNCVMDSGRATCWNNPGDTTPPPPPPTDPGGGSGPGTCGTSCNSSSDCNSGLSCQDISGKICWDNGICGGGPDRGIRISGKVFACNGAGKAGVRVSALGNSVTTNAQGQFTVTKNASGHPVIAVLSGADAGGTGYYSRVASPTFNRGGNCNLINCNYTAGLASGGPSRQAYISSPTLSTSQYEQLFYTSSSSDYFQSFDFRELNCPQPSPTLGAQLQPPMCTKNNWPTSSVIGGNLTFAATGSDPDSTVGPTVPSLSFFFTKQAPSNYCAIGTGLATQGKWQQIGAQVNSLSGSVSLNTSGLPSGNYIVVANVRDNDNQFSTGNPGPPLGCGFPTNACQGTFTLTSNPSVTPSISPPSASPTPIPPSHPFSVQVNIWEGNNCSNTSTPVTNPFSATIVAKLNGQVSGTNHDIIHSITIPGLQSGQTSTFSLTNLPTGWSRASCSPGTVSRQQFSQGPVNFWVQQAVGPWWQSAAGDIYGFVVESAIPAISNGFLTLKLGLSEPGAFIYGLSKTVPDNQLREINPVYKAKTNPNLQENYAYFDTLTRDFEKIAITGNTLPPLPTMSPNRQATLLKKSGDLFLSSSWGSNRKLVIFVDGNLNINANQSVPLGSYLHFVVKGTITIAGSVTQLEGMYSADGNILIESSTNRFVSKGSVVSFSANGIESRRSLSGVNNNTQAATVYEFRPDLVINTPREMRTTTSTWSEVSPD